MLPPIIANLLPDLARSNTLSDTQVERLVIEAIHAGTLASVAREMCLLGPEVLPPRGRDRVESAASACAAIAEYNRAERSRMVERLRAAGVDARPTDDCGLQSHAVALRLAPGDVSSALDVAATAGFMGGERWRRQGALKPLLRIRRDLTVIRTDDVTTRLTLRWRDKGKRGRLARLLEPAETDFDVARWPDVAWPLHRLNKPIRLGMTKLGRPPRGHVAPFLGTPAELIPALLDAAGVTADDVLIDLGCGDGRIVVEAARLRNCRATGVERDDELVMRARERAEAAGLEERVRIERGDLAAVDLEDVTVAFLFLPHDTIRRLLPTIRARLGPRARVVIHEQARIDPALGPDRSTPLIGRASMTVAHLWGVG